MSSSSSLRLQSDAPPGAPRPVRAGIEPSRVGFAVSTIIGLFAGGRERGGILYRCPPNTSDDNFRALTHAAWRIDKYEVDDQAG